MEASLPASAIAADNPCGVPLAWKTTSQSRGASAGAANPAPSTPAMVARAGSISASVTCVPGMRPHSHAIRQTDHAGPDNRDPVGRTGLRVPDGVERRFHVGGEHGAVRRHGVRQRKDGVRRQNEQRLMRIERKTVRPVTAGSPASTRPTLAYPYFTGNGKAPPMKGAFMRSCSSGGTRPEKTSASEPRLIPLCKARTRTSPGRGSAVASSRISERPGATCQSARAISCAL
jgi:hypothetical protein